MSRGKVKANYLHRAGLVGLNDAPDYDFLYVASATKDPKWNIGDRVVLPDGRVFRYAKAGANCYTGQGCGFYKAVAMSANSAAAQVAGDKQITFASQTFTEDELRGGYIVIYGADNSDVQQRGIIGNTVASGSTVTVYLDAALAIDVATAKYCEILYNPYSDLRTGAGGSYVSIAGIAAAEADADEYFWVQTWGPCWIAPGEAGVGGDANERTVIFDGSVGALHEFSDGTFGTDAQVAGFIIQRDSSGTDGPPFIMLQISI